MSAPEKICIDETSLDEDGFYLASEPGNYRNVDIEYTLTSTIPTWRTDMENAPRGGADVLVNVYGVPYIAWRYDGKWISNDEDAHGEVPTHWMPLPKPPQSDD